MTAQAPDDTAVSERPPARGGNAVGIAAFACGALALAPVAIVLGIWGLVRYRRGRASRRSWPLAGLILGIVASVAAGVGWYFYSTSTASASAETADAYARVDTVNVGNALVDYFVAHPESTSVDVAVAGGGYRVDDASVAAALEEPADVSVEVVDAYDWCLTVRYAGGNGEVLSFDAVTGLAAGASCPAS